MNNNSNLIDLVYLLKKENFNLQKEITNITIECNKILRNGKQGKESRKNYQLYEIYHSYDFLRRFKK